MAKTFNVVVERGEDGYLISEVIELPGCHTQAKTHDELMKRTKEAIKLYLEAESSQLEPVVKFLGLEKVQVEA
ncbi:MAG TPA: type II toxin-antitoxin system HicB family antitoxin [archaeon]|nr:type II toxin-antitoxin system HicB family antitoxin [archaeon]